MNNKLKSCPFCGGKAILFESHTFAWTIECKDCEVGIGHDDKETVIKIWNRRTFNPVEIAQWRMANEK